MPETLVLLPGMMCDGRLFGPQIAAFSASRAVLLAPINGAATVGELAASVLADAPPRFALAGLSMGGIVAMEIVRQAPGRVARIALLGTNPLAEAADVRAAREPQIAAVRAGGLVGVIEAVLPRYAGAAPLDPGVAGLVRVMAAALGPEAFVRQSRALQSRPDQRATLAAATCPAILLCGSADAPCPVARTQLMAAAMPHAVVAILDGVGHLSTLEAPDKVNAALAGWLEA